MADWLALLIAVAILASVPFLIRWGRKNARGSAGGVAMALGLAFGHLFDPKRAEATEELQNRRENGKLEEQAGELRGPGE